jgi:hypothetical protein
MALNKRSFLLACAGVLAMAGSVSAMAAVVAEDLSGASLSDPYDSYEPEPVSPVKLQKVDHRSDDDGIADALMRAIEGSKNERVPRRRNKFGGFEGY